jgi:hypothetical protein
LETPAQQLRRALVPGATTERYNRLWRLGQVHERNGYLHGRIGFEAKTGADLWDETELDFKPQDVPGGVATPFVIRLSDLVVIFQTRAQDIRVTSFTSALKGILSEGTRERWDVVSIKRTTSFRQWRETVRTVHRLRFQLARPNPNYEGRPEVERIIERMRLSKATLEFFSDEGIDTDAELTQQMLDHVDRGYGHAMAAGERDTDGVNVETVWSSELHGESLVTTAPADEATGEVSVDILIMELTELAEAEEL